MTMVKNKITKWLTGTKMANNWDIILSCPTSSHTTIHTVHRRQRNDPNFGDNGLKHAKIYKKSNRRKRIGRFFCDDVLILERSATHRAMSAWASRTSSTTCTAEVTETVCKREDDVSSKRIITSLHVVVGRI